MLTVRALGNILWVFSKLSHRFVEQTHVILCLYAVQNECWWRAVIRAKLWCSTFTRISVECVDKCLEVYNPGAIFHRLRGETISKCIGFFYLLKARHALNVVQKVTTRHSSIHAPRYEMCSGVASWRRRLDMPAVKWCPSCGCVRTFYSSTFVRAHQSNQPGLNGRTHTHLRDFILNMCAAVFSFK